MKCNICGENSIHFYCAQHMKKNPLITPKVLNNNIAKSAQSKALSTRKRVDMKIKMLAKWKFECFWCGMLFKSKKEVTLDHLIPRSKGGKNNKDNLVLACMDCNTKKADMMPLTFLNRNRK
jgi:5-methylcytosine-specific restriction endonuclease McrA